MAKLHLTAKHISESTFAAVCVAICGEHAPTAMESGFPLRGRIRLKSHVGLAFEASDFSLSSTPDGPPTLRLAFLTLAGIGGPLPIGLSERLLWSRGSAGGEAFHEFLDLINRRFWELLLLAQAAGSNAHYVLLDRQRTRYLENLMCSFTGLERCFSPPFQTAGIATQRHLDQMCVEMSTGTGDARQIATFLQQVLGSDISIREHQPVRLPISESSIVRLGRRDVRDVVKGQVLGRRGWVACALQVCIHMALPDQLAGFLPLASGDKLKLLKQMLTIRHSPHMPPWSLLLRVPASERQSQLGSSNLRLGWGARLGSKLPASQLVEVSYRALRFNPEESFST